MLKCLWKLQKLWTDDRGAIVSIELILIVTIAVLALVVGWSEVANAVNTELDDISNAIGHFDQSFFFSGFRSFKMFGGIKSSYNGSAFFDLPDDCDGNCSGYSSITCSGPGVGVGGGFGNGAFGYAPGPGAVVSPGGPDIPCPTADCVTDPQGNVLTPQPDHHLPQFGPGGPPTGQPIGPPPALHVPQPSPLN